MALYGRAFYNSQEDGSLRSARLVVPYMLELTGARSVCDVGCGTGSWLSVFRELGADDIQGFDGRWVRREALRIPADRFTVVDLARPPAPPRRFDLAMTMEVAEHVEAGSAEAFTDFLTGLSDVIAFGAAIPHQGGTGHVNEQWPEYWRAKFEAGGFVGFDPFRERFWNEPAVEWWYAQNLFLYARADAVERFADLPRIGQKPGWPERLIHPGLPASKDEIIAAPSLGYVVKRLPGAIRRELARRL